MARLLLVAVSVCLLAALLPSTAAQGLTWSQVPADGDSQPAARREPAIGYDGLGNRLIVFGGVTANGTVDDTWIFEIDSGNWTEVQSTQAPTARWGAFFGVVRVSSVSLFVVTHGTRGMDEFADVWAFNFNTMQWNLIATQGDGPGPRYGGHFGAAYGDTDILWVGAGFTGTTPLFTRYIDTYKLTFTSLTEATWEEVYPQPTIGNQFMPLSPHGRCLQASAVVGNEGLVMAGGCMRGGTGGGPCPTDDTWFFNTSTRRWSDLPRCITPRAFGKMAALSNNPGKAVMYGGNDMFSKQLIDVARYPEDEVFVVDVLENQWTRYRVNSTEYPWRRFQFGMAAARDGDIYMFGGLNLSNKNFLDDLWILSGDPKETEDVPCNNVWFSYAHLHGILMFLAFGFLLPLGVVVAQSSCHCKRSKAWFIIHVILQITAVLLSIAGFIMIFSVAERAGVYPSHPHAIIGIFLMFFTLIQPINGIFRPHIKQDEAKSKYRVCWEWFHRIYGAFIIILGFVQVTLGVFLIVPPQGVWVAWITVLGTWVIHFIVRNIVRICCFLRCRRKQDENEGYKMKKLG